MCKSTKMSVVGWLVGGDGNFYLSKHSMLWSGLITIRRNQVLLSSLTEVSMKSKNICLTLSMTPLGWLTGTDWLLSSVIF